MSLLTTCKLNSYLADIDEQAEDMFSRVVKEMAKKQGVTEQLKEDNQIAWIGAMNNIRACATEIVNWKSFMHKTMRQGEVSAALLNNMNLHFYCLLHKNES